MQVKEQQLEPDLEQWTGSKLGKEFLKAVYCYPAYLTYLHVYHPIYQLDKAQTGIKIGRRNINNLRYADDTILMAESEELNSLLMKVKEESEKVGLKFHIQKTKIMAASPITSWEIDRKTIKPVMDFIYLGFKSLQMVTAAMKLKDACSLEEKLWPT